MDGVKRDDWATLAPWAALIGVLAKAVNAAAAAVKYSVTVPKARDRGAVQFQATCLARTVSWPATTAARSAAGNGASGGATRAHCGSP